MRSTVSREILNVHDFGSRDMRTGIIPFGSSKGYGLTSKQKLRLHSQFVNSSIGSNRVVGMADRAKAMIVRLFEDVANFAENRIERIDLIKALNQGISFGRERGMQLVNSKFDLDDKVTISSTRSSTSPKTELLV